MAETLEAPVQVQEQPQQGVNIPEGFNPFKADNWTEAPSAVQTISFIPPTTEVATTESTSPAQTSEPVIAQPDQEEEIFDENDFVKARFGFDTTEEAIKQFNELKAAKEKGFEFSNEDSRKVFEYLKEGKNDDLYDYLDRQKKINKILSAEKIDENVASQMIKMGMQAKYKDLTPDEINYKFNKQFSIPAKPVKDEANETDEEFAQKLSKWEEKANEVKMDLIIEAKLAKPELEKLKSELVLPDIKRSDAQSHEPSAEVLAQAQAARDKFLTTLNGNFKNFKGYETKVKDGLVEIPVSFEVPEEEKIAQKTEIESIEDIVQYFNQMWFDDKQNLNAEQIMADLYLLKNRGKVFQGLVNNAASQRLVEHIKTSSNINLKNNGSSAPTTTQTIEPNGNSVQDQVAGFWKTKY